MAAALLPIMPSATSNPFDRVPPDRWLVDWGDTHCSLIRRAADPELPVITLRTVPGTRRWELSLIKAEWPFRMLSNVERLRLTLDPGGPVDEGNAIVERKTSGRALAVHTLPETFLQTFAASRAVRFERDGEALFEIPYSDPTRAIEALRECEDDVMRQFGIDPAAYRAVRSPPFGNLAQFLSNSDYPASALRARREGSVTIRVTVNTSGRVTECAPIISSGFQDLDDATCNVMVRRARMRPATGLDGEPTRSMLVATVTWAIQ